MKTHLKPEERNARKQRIRRVYSLERWTRHGIERVGSERHENVDNAAITARCIALASPPSEGPKAPRAGPPNLAEGSELPRA